MSYEFVGSGRWCYYNTTEYHEMADSLAERAKASPATFEKLTRKGDGAAVDSWRPFFASFTGVKLKLALSYCGVR